MKLDSAFLRSKVARRIFFLFALCAFLPITIVALVSFRSVSGELQEQGERQLAQVTKSQAMSIIERLELLDMELLLCIRTHTGMGI